MFSGCADQGRIWIRKGSRRLCHVCNGRGADLCSQGHWPQVVICLLTIKNALRLSNLLWNSCYWGLCGFENIGHPFQEIIFLIRTGLVLYVIVQLSYSIVLFCFKIPSKSCPLSGVWTSYMNQQDCIAPAEWFQTCNLISFFFRFLISCCLFQFLLLYKLFGCWHRWLTQNNEIKIVFNKQRLFIIFS